MGSQFQFTTTLPRRRYAVGDYAHIDPDAIGKIIPIGYGTLTDIVPVEIDTTVNRYKILDQAVAEITQIRSQAGAVWPSSERVLVKDLDYTEYLSLAEFVLLKPAYVAGTTWFSIESDYAQSGTNYIELSRNVAAYAYGTSYEIDSGNTWQADVDDYDLLFVVYGKTSSSATEAVVATNTTPDATPKIGLKDAEPRTKIGQSFIPTVNCFITRITVYVTRHGTLTGKNIRATLYSDAGSTTIGPAGTWVSIGTGPSTLNPTFSERNEDVTLECDVKAPGTELAKVATILPDVITNVMGRASSRLDAAELANLSTDRDQVLKIFLKETMTFGDFIAKLESGQLWKLVPLQDGNYGTIVYETGAPANTLTVRDEDFLSFKMNYDSSQLKQAVTVFYDQNATSGDYLAVQVTSQVAKFFYLNESELTVETFLKTLADADQLADDYVARYEVPIITAIFEIHAKGIELLPGRDKVKLYRTRAPYTGGTLNGILMRIISLTKKPEDNVVAITAAIWGNSAT